MSILNNKDYDFYELFEFLFYFGCIKKERIKFADFIPYIKSSNGKEFEIRKEIVHLLLNGERKQDELNLIADSLAKIYALKLSKKDEVKISAVIVSSFFPLLWIKKITGLDLISKIPSYLSPQQRKILYQWVLIILKKQFKNDEEILNPVEKFTKILSSEDNHCFNNANLINDLLITIEKAVLNDETLFFKLIEDLHFPSLLRKISLFSLPFEKIITPDVLLMDNNFQIIPVIVASSLINKEGKEHWARIAEIISNLETKETFKVLGKILFLLYNNEKTRYTKITSSCLSLAFLKLEIGMNGKRPIPFSTIFSSEFYTFFIISHLIGGLPRNVKECLKEWLIETGIKILKNEVEIPSYLPDDLMIDALTQSFEKVFFDGDDINISEINFQKFLTSIEPYFHCQLFGNNNVGTSLKRRLKIFYSINSRLLRKKNKNGKFPLITKSVKNTLKRFDTNYSTFLTC